MSNFKYQKKANKIRTKLLLLIANESIINIENNTNLSMLNSISLNEINKQYQIKNFKITIDNKVINGGKNLCINYSSKVKSRPFINNLLNEQFEKYTKNNSKLESIKIGIKRKISQYKLNIIMKKEKKIKINPKKLKLIEIQKNYIYSLREMANLLKKYSLNKKTNQNYNRQKSVNIRENDISIKLKKKLDKNINFFNNEENQNINDNVKNKSSKKKKNFRQHLRIDTDIDDNIIEDKNHKVKSVNYYYTRQNYKSLYNQNVEEETIH